MTEKKKLIVLIPHFNNPEGLRDSIFSIDESFDVDVMVVDDGSKIMPNEKEISNGYKYGKVFFEYLSENKGVGHALNHGLKKIQQMNYEWVGRLDAGDFNKKDKYAKQFTYLEKHPEIKLLGTWANMLDEKGNLKFILRHPEHHREIKNKMYINNRFVHPSVIFKVSVIDTVGYYPEKYAKAAQDYAYFFQIMKHFQVGNLPEPLIDYVLDENSISTKKRKLQVKNRIKIILDNFNFGFHSFYGVLRNICLLFLSRQSTTRLKQVLKKK